MHDEGASSRARPGGRAVAHAQGMVRFSRKFFRDAYPQPSFWLVLAGLWLRFAGLTTVALLNRGFLGVLGR